MAEHAMRRARQQMSEEEAWALVDGATSGVLCLVDADGEPYGVPLSHARSGDRLLFHTAVTGHKLDAVRACDRASFTVVAADDVHAMELTTYFRSAICFGRVRVLEDEEEVRSALRTLGERFLPGRADVCDAEIEGAIGRVAAIELRVERITGKQAKELAFGARG